MNQVIARSSEPLSRLRRLVPERHRSSVEPVNVPITHLVHAMEVSV
jgi:hypothetical protein